MARLVPQFPFVSALACLKRELQTMPYRRHYLLSALAGLVVSVAGLLPHNAVAQGIAVHFKLVSRDLVDNRLLRFSKDNSMRESNLKAVFVEAGCAAEHLEEQPVKHEKLPNVICTLAAPNGSVILVGAHYDHVLRGDGVVDNWSGAALLPSLFESLREEPRKHTFIFVGFAAEEEGLVGSAFYAKQLAPVQVADMRAMINMDSLGLGPTKVWLTHSDKNLVSALDSVANSLKLPVAGVNADQVGDDDSSSFRKVHVPTLMLHSITQDTLKVLHSNEDKLSAIREDDYYDSYHLIAGYLAYIDELLD